MPQVGWFAAYCVFILSRISMVGDFCSQPYYPGASTFKPSQREHSEGNWIPGCAARPGAGQRNVILCAPRGADAWSWGHFWIPLDWAEDRTNPTSPTPQGWGQHFASTLPRAGASCCRSQTTPALRASLGANEFSPAALASPTADSSLPGTQG